MKKATRKSRVVKSVKNLPAKSLSAKGEKRVKGGADTPSESLSLNYGQIKWTYTTQDTIPTKK